VDSIGLPVKSIFGQPRARTSEPGKEADESSNDPERKKAYYTAESPDKNGGYSRSGIQGLAFFATLYALGSKV